MPLDPSIILASKPFDIQAAIKAAQDRQIQIRAQQDEHLLRGQQLANEQLQNRAGALTLQEKLKDIADEDTVKQMYAQASSGGAEPSDADIISKMGSRGLGIIKNRNDARKAHADLQKSIGEAGTAKADYLGHMAAGVAQMGNTPEALASALQHIANDYPEEAKSMAAQMPTSPEEIAKLTDRMIAESPAQRKIRAEEETAKARMKGADTGEKKLGLETPGLIAGGQEKQVDAIGKSAQAALGQYQTVNDQDAHEAWFNRLPAPVAERLGATSKFDPANKDKFNRAMMTAEQRVQADQAAENAKSTNAFREAELKNAAARLGLERERLFQDKEQTVLTPQALDKAAEMFATTGQLPAFGMGAAAAKIRGSVMNRAAEVYPHVQFGTNKAVYDANKSSLSGLTKQNDLVTAYEATAGKNLDQFLNTTSKLVDTGSPLLNQPVRSINLKGLGSEDLAAVNAARNVAMAEIARILTASPTGGGVVSDSARNEANSLIGPDATIKQIRAAADILRKDMKNRLESNNDQIKAIKDRLAAPAVEGSNAPVQKWGRDANGNPVKQ